MPPSGFDRGVFRDGKVHGSVLQFVFEDDGPTVQTHGLSCLRCNRGVRAGHGRRLNRAPGLKVPVVGVLIPHDVSETHRLSDATNAVVDVAVRRSPAGGCDLPEGTGVLGTNLAKDLFETHTHDRLDGFQRVPKLGKHLFVGHCREVSM